MSKHQIIITTYLTISLTATSVPTDVVQGNELQWSKALPDLTEEGVFLQTRKAELLHFTCDDSTCAWNVIDQRIQTPVDSSVFMYLPPGYTECECNGGFTGDACDIATCPGKPICGGMGTCPEGGVLCDCSDDEYIPGLYKE